MAVQGVDYGKAGGGYFRCATTTGTFSVLSFKAVGTHPTTYPAWFVENWENNNNFYSEFIFKLEKPADIVTGATISGNWTNWCDTHLRTGTPSECNHYDSISEFIDSLAECEHTLEQVRTKLDISSFFCRFYTARPELKGRLVPFTNHPEYLNPTRLVNLFDFTGYTSYAHLEDAGWIPNMWGHNVPGIDTSKATGGTCVSYLSQLNAEYADGSATSGAKQDPHLVFANGATADFRGAEDAYFNFLSYPRFSVNVRTQASTFEYKNIVVNGTYMTEIFLTAITAKNKKLFYSQSSLRANDNNWGWEMSNGTCAGKSFSTRPHSTRVCDEFRARTELSTTLFTFGKWNVRVSTNHVYGYISGAKRRLDLKIPGPRNDKSHGILGQSFNTKHSVKSGELDVYPTSGMFQTTAQARGSIEANYTFYQMKGPYTTDYYFSTFDDVLEHDGSISRFSDHHNFSSSR